MAKHIEKKGKKDGRRFSGKASVKMARRVTWVGFWWNVFLGIIKVLGGIFSRSSALVADGIHSFSDFFSDIIVIMMVGIARKRPDESHQFGHGRFEALATLILSLILVVVAIGIFYEGMVKIIDYCHGEALPKPGWIALAIVAFSIVIKEWLYHYTRHTGEEIKSEVIVANAWHHRTDSFSSIATLIGVAGAMFLGEKWRILDPVAAIVVGVFIVIVGIQLASPALKEMLGASLEKEQRREILKALRNTPGIMGYSNFRTFKSGNDGYVIVRIKVDPEITVREAHQIASLAEHNLRLAVKDLKIHSSTHIEPFEGKAAQES